MSIEQAKELAKWRRAGHGVWHLEYIVEGFDEVFEVVAPGKCSEEFAVEWGRMTVYRKLGVRRKFVHHKSTRKEA